MWIRKLILLAVILVVGIGGTLGYQWYAYVTNVNRAKDPYDEIGIELNSRMPMPLRKWGCLQLQKRFGDMYPPYGCAAANGDGKGWM